MKFFFPTPSKEITKIDLNKYLVELIDTINTNLETVSVSFNGSTTFLVFSGNYFDFIINKEKI